jgi:hypothetical protein
MSRLPPHASRTSIHVSRPPSTQMKMPKASTGTTKRRHLPRLSLDTRFTRIPIRGEDSFLSFSATADTYACPSSGVHSASYRRRPTPSYFSPDTPGVDIIAPPGSPASELWTPMSALSPLSPSLRAPPPTPAQDARSPVIRAPPSSPVPLDVIPESPLESLLDSASPFERPSFVPWANAFADVRSPISPIATPPSAVKFSDVYYLWDYAPAPGVRQVDGQHPYGVDWEDTNNGEVYPYAAT